LDNVTYKEKEHVKEVKEVEKNIVVDVKSMTKAVSKDLLEIDYHLE